MAVQARPATLADVVLPRGHRLLRDALLVLAAGSALALFARIAIPLPFTPVPVTGQTLGVLLTGALLGPRRGALALLAYLGEGLAGLPVFAGGLSAWSPGSAGLPEIVGPTAGYLFAFPLAAWGVGWLAERGWDRQFGRAVLAMLAGDALIFALGVAWLARFVGAAQALPLGLLPFLPGDLLKVLLAAAVLPSAWRLFGSAGAARPGAG